jgi:O-antigen/teichoic acid export membrane protein
MTSDAQNTVWNAGWILVQRALHAGSGLVFALVVPRFMGPDIYGRYSLLTSLSIWFVLFSSLNLTDVIGRYVPEFIFRDDRKGLTELWSDLLTVRLASGTLAAMLYLGVTALWLRDLDALVLAAMAGTVLVQAIADLLFAAFVGFSQAARWQMGETLRQWLSMGLLLVGFYLGGLRGAVFGLLLTELGLLALGIGWIQPYLAWPGLHFDVRRSLPYLQFGLLFFAGDVLRTAMGVSGETVVRAVTGDYVQVGYFGLARRVFVTMALAIPQLSLAFVPLLTTLHARDDIEALTRWIERLLKYLLLGGVVASFGAFLLAGHLVPLVLGAQYSPVAGNLVWLTLNLLPIAITEAARLVAVVYLRPRVALTASLMQLLAFWILGVLLVGRLGSLGSSVTALATRMLSAAYLTWRMRSVLRYSLRESVAAIGLALPFLPLALVRSSVVIHLSLYGLFILGYFAILLFTGVVTRSEAAQLWQGITRRAGASDIHAGEE